MSVSYEDLDVIQGDSYSNANGRALDFVKPSGATWPTDLTVWTITLTADYKGSSQSGTIALSVTGSVVVATGSTQTVRFEPTAAQTSVLAPGTNDWKFNVKATSGSDTATLVSGNMSVIEPNRI